MLTYKSDFKYIVTELASVFEEEKLLNWEIYFSLN